MPCSPCPSRQQDGQAPVVVKIEFPNIAESVASDLSYIRILLTVGRLLPRGLFLDKMLAVLHVPIIMHGETALMMTCCDRS